MATKKSDKALVSLHGYEGEYELIEIVNSTAVLMLDRKVMTGVWNIKPLNKKAEVILGAEVDG